MSMSYQSCVNSCNRTRIYPDGCCPFNNECDCCCCRQNGDNLRNGSFRRSERSDRQFRRGEDGVNRINFCPCGTNTCEDANNTSTVRKTE